MQGSLIRNVLFCGPAISLLSACASTTEEQIPIIETRTVQIQRPAPIVPTVDQLRLRNVQWRVVTPDNVEDIFQSLSGDVVLFAMTSDGYESLALNLSDLRAMIEQQQIIIALYESSFR